MKKTVLIFLLSILGFSCGTKGIEKPDHLLTEVEMENAMYDLALLQVMMSYTEPALQENGIVADKYIYKKYKIDSLTMAQNQEYYASDLETFKKIQGRITERLRKQKTALDTLIARTKKAEELKNAKPLAPVKKDSVVKKASPGKIRRAERSR